MLNIEPLKNLLFLLVCIVIFMGIYIIGVTIERFYKVNKIESKTRIIPEVRISKTDTIYIYRSK